MFETNIIGNKEWTRGFLCEADVRCLEDFDCDMRFRYLKKKKDPSRVQTYEHLVEKHGEKVPTHCEHGIPLNRRCGICHAMFG